MNDYVRLGPVGRSYGGISFAPRKELICFAYQIWKMQFLSVVQFTFDNCLSPFSPTTFFEIGVYIRIFTYKQLLAVANLNKVEPLKLNFRQLKLLCPVRHSFTCNLAGNSCESPL